MKRQLVVAVAEGLEHGKRFALGENDATHHDMQQKCRYGQEDRGQDGGLGTLLAEFLLEETVRLLVVPGLGAGGAVAVQQPVEPVADAGHIGPGLNADQQLVEGAVHAEGLGQGAFVQPQRGVAQVVGQQIGRCCLVDHFRAARDAADLQARVAPSMIATSVSSGCRR